jgi:heterodisulfide reductase subunit A-like polyferredoxin
MKLRPVDFAKRNLYGWVSCQDKLVSNHLKGMLVGGVVAVVDGERCAACLTCVRVCPYEVPVINAKGEAEIDVAKCKGCGSCVAECPARAIELMHFRNSQLEAKSQALVMSLEQSA